MTTDRLFPMLLGSSASFERYADAVSSIPMLSADEEHHLATQLHEQECVQSAQKLILSHLRFVVHIARGYMGYGLPLPDLVQEGNVGLMKAVKRFNPFAGARLATFAVHWIKAEIHDFVLKNWGIVKIATTKAQRKLFFNLRRAKRERNWLSPAEISHVAEQLNVPEYEVVEMESRLSSHDISFDAPNSEDDEKVYAPEHILTCESSDLERKFMLNKDGADEVERVRHALASLSERNREIVQARVMRENKATLQELAEQYGVSLERIRQLEKQALGQLKAALTA